MCYHSGPLPVRLDQFSLLFQWHDSPIRLPSNDDNNDPTPFDNDVSNTIAVVLLRLDGVWSDTHVQVG